MNMPYMLHLGGFSEEAEACPKNLIAHVDACPCSKMENCPFPRTVDEHMVFVNRLLSKSDRANALKEQLGGYATVVKSHKRWNMVYKAVGQVTIDLRHRLTQIVACALICSSGLKQVKQIMDEEARTQRELASNDVDKDLVCDLRHTAAVERAQQPRRLGCSGNAH